jgi:hypothetical protein
MVEPINYYEMYSGLGNSVAQLGSDMGNVVQKVSDFVGTKNSIRTLEDVVMNKMGKPFHFPEGTTSEQAAYMVAKWGHFQQMIESKQKEVQLMAKQAGVNVGDYPIGTVNLLPTEAFTIKDKDFEDNLNKYVEDWKNKIRNPQIEKNLTGVPTQTGGPLLPKQTAGGEPAPYQPVTTQLANPYGKTSQEITTSLGQAGLGKEEIGSLSALGQIKQQENAAVAGGINPDASIVENFKAAIQNAKGAPLSEDVINTIKSIKDPLETAKLYAYIDNLQNKNQLTVKDAAKLYDSIQSSNSMTAARLAQIEDRLREKTIGSTEKYQLDLERRTIKENIKDGTAIQLSMLKYIKNPKALGQSAPFLGSLKAGEKEAGAKEAETTAGIEQNVNQEKQQIFERLKAKGLVGTGPWYQTNKTALNNLQRELSTELMNSKYIKPEEAGIILQEYLDYLKQPSGQNSPLATPPGTTSAQPGRFKITQVK